MTKERCISGVCEQYKRTRIYFSCPTQQGGAERDCLETDFSAVRIAAKKVQGNYHNLYGSIPTLTTLSNLYAGERGSLASLCSLSGACDLGGCTVVVRIGSTAELQRVPVPSTPHKHVSPSTITHRAAWSSPLAWPPAEFFLNGSLHGLN